MGLSMASLAGLCNRSYLKLLPKGYGFTPGGGTPLYGLNGDVRPDRVWFSEDFVLNGVLISLIFVLNRVSLQDLMYSLTTEPSEKPNFYQFANVQDSETRISL